MTDVSLLREQGIMRVTWPDGRQGDYPFEWLRDNCPSAYHRETRERVQDLLQFPVDIAPRDASLDDGHIRIGWEVGDHVSMFPLQWLAENVPGRPLHDPAETGRVAWRSDISKADLPRGDAASLLVDDEALYLWLAATRSYGLSLVNGLADDPQSGMSVARRIGFLRETNFGKTFEVKSKVKPNNLAFTAEALPLHTDLANQEVPPGYQFLHCIANEAVGGGSVFADGMTIAEDMRAKSPEAFELLSTTSIPFRFHDDEYDIRRRQNVITLAEDGEFSEICWNAHLAGVFDMPADELHAYYRAYREFMAATRDPAYRIEFSLSAGEMVVFDNRRVLHGRAAFDPNTGYRFLHGCYVDRGEFDSRLRVLARGGAGGYP